MVNGSRIVVDADACPVKEEIVSVAQREDVDVLFIASYAAFRTDDQWKSERIRTVYVDQGYQAADMYIANATRSGDVVVTNDYGLAALCLTRGAKVISPRGSEITQHNLDELLIQRHLSSKARRAGQRTKGPRAISVEDLVRFQHKLTKLLHKQQENVTS